MQRKWNIIRIESFNSIRYRLANICKIWNDLLHYENVTGERGGEMYRQDLL